MDECNDFICLPGISYSIAGSPHAIRKDEGQLVPMTSKEVLKLSSDMVELTQQLSHESFRFKLIMEGDKCLSQDQACNLFLALDKSPLVYKMIVGGHGKTLTLVNKEKIKAQFAFWNCNTSRFYVPSKDVIEEQQKKGTKSGPRTRRSTNVAAVTEWVVLDPSLRPKIGATERNNIRSQVAIEMGDASPANKSSETETIGDEEDDKEITDVEIETCAKKSEVGDDSEVTFAPVLDEEPHRNEQITKKRFILDRAIVFTVVRSAILPIVIETVDQNEAMADEQLMALMQTKQEIVQEAAAKGQLKMKSDEQRLDCFIAKGEIAIEAAA